jgi:hypothetical protein
MDVVGGSRFTVWDASSLAGLAAGQREELCAVIDALGQESAKVGEFASSASAVSHFQVIPRSQAQNIANAFTSAEKLSSQADHRLYLTCDSRGVIAMMKVGPKHLYMIDAKGAYQEKDPLCVLDFFVVHQRQGLGIELFNFALERESATADALAYDRPSGMMLPFLAKHFGLTEYSPQPNNFVMFS